MNSRRDEDATDPRNPVVDSIADSRRRALLGALLGRSSPADVRELAGRLASADGTDRRRVRVDLVHAHLPKLERAGLLSWDREESTVAVAAHPALDDPRFRRLLEAEGDGLDETLSTLAARRRRLLVTVLRDERRPMPRAELAEELLRRESGGDGVGPRERARVVASLHHVHLPMLADAGLIDYDRDADRVAYADHPALEEVFSIVQGERLCDSYDGFIAGLSDAYERFGRTTDGDVDWSNFWTDPHHG